MLLGARVPRLRGAAAFCAGLPTGWLEPERLAFEAIALWGCLEPLAVEAARPVPIAVAQPFGHTDRLAERLPADQGAVKKVFKFNTFKDMRPNLSGRDVRRIFFAAAGEARRSLGLL